MRMYIEWNCMIILIILIMNRNRGKFALIIKIVKKFALIKMKQNKICEFPGCNSKNPTAWKKGKNICTYCFNKSKWNYTPQYQYFKEVEELLLKVKKPHHNPLN